MCRYLLGLVKGVEPTVREVEVGNLCGSLSCSPPRRDGELHVIYIGPDDR